MQVIICYASFREHFSHRYIISNKNVKRKSYPHPDSFSTTVLRSMVVRLGLIMNYKLELNDRPFRAIKAGTKKIEARVPTSKDKFSYGSLEPGDIITFTNDSTQETMAVEVLGVKHYPDFCTLLEFEGIKNTLSSGKTINEAVKSFDKFSEYKENIPKYGVYAIRIKLMNNAV